MLVRKPEVKTGIIVRVSKDSHQDRPFIQRSGCVYIFERLRSLINDGGDGREPDGNNATGLDWQNITLFCTFLCRRCTTTT